MKEIRCPHCGAVLQEATTAPRHTRFEGFREKLYGLVKAHPKLRQADYVRLFKSKYPDSYRSVFNWKLEHLPSEHSIGSTLSLMTTEGFFTEEKVRRAGTRRRRMYVRGSSERGGEWEWRDVPYPFHKLLIAVEPPPKFPTKFPTTKE